MLRSQTLIGRHITRACGERLGIVHDLIVDHASGTVLAFAARVNADLDEQAGLDEQVVPFEAVFELQADAVVVTHKDDLVPISKLPRLNAARDRSLRLGEARLVNAEGRVLGVIQGVRFDEETGELLGYEVENPDGQGCSLMVVPVRQVEPVDVRVATASPTTVYLWQQMTSCANEVEPQKLSAS